MDLYEISHQYVYLGSAEANFMKLWVLEGKWPFAMTTNLYTSLKMGLIFAFLLIIIHC